MKKHLRTLKAVAKNHKIDPDEVLIILWDYFSKRFDYLKNENSIIKNKDLKLVQGAIASKIRNEKIEIKQEKKLPAKVVTKDYDFSVIGKINYSISHITKKEIVKIHEELATNFTQQEDPIYPPGIKDDNLLESALFRPQTSFGGKIKYPTVESAGASLMYAISSNHSFYNGNKRTAMVATLILLDRHHLCLTCNDDDLFKISVKLADHKLVDKDYGSSQADAETFELAKWIDLNSKIVTKGERVVTLKKLKRILTNFNCQVLENGHVERILPKKWFGIKKNERLVSKMKIGNTISEGAEVSKVLIKSIRDDLKLNSENGIDSDIFYGEAEFTSSDFIIKYQNLLRRLAKV